MSRPGPTADPRVRAQQEDNERTALRQHRADVVKLLQLPEFRRYVADLCFGYLGVDRLHVWRRDAEMHRAAARHDVGITVLDELAQVDVRAVALLKHEHVDYMAGAAVVDPPTPRENDE